MVAKNTTANPTTRKPRASKKAAAAAAVLNESTIALNHDEIFDGEQEAKECPAPGSLFVDSGDKALNDLIASLESPDEIVEVAPVAAEITAALPSSEPIKVATHEPDAGDMALDALIAQLDSPAEEIDDNLLSAAVAGAEATEEVVASVVQIDRKSVV